MKQIYSIGDLEFKTKKACEDYTRDIINSLGCCIINKDNSHFIFFNNLIRNHPDYELKKGIGIDYFYIQPNPINKKSFQTMLKRLDGSETDFSWIYCCSFKIKTPNDILKIAMRTAISDDIIYFKQNQKQLICKFCEVKDKPYEYYHVDHHNPSFKNLKDNFLNTTTRPIPFIFQECKVYKLKDFRDEDIDFKKDWIEYHNNNCNLQVLCQDCNLRKEKT